jgi:hypothetical protein
MPGRYFTMLPNVPGGTIRNDPKEEEKWLI